MCAKCQRLLLTAKREMLVQDVRMSLGVPDFQVAGTMETPSPRHRKELPNAVGYHHHIHTAFKKKKLINKLPRLYTTTPPPLQPLTSRDDLNYTFAIYACIAFLVLIKIHFT